jgi:hypothetical protein
MYELLRQNCTLMRSQLRLAIMKMCFHSPPAIGQTGSLSAAALERPKYQRHCSFLIVALLLVPYSLHLLQRCQPDDLYTLCHLQYHE